MRRVTVVDLGAEGGRATVYGTRVDGQWSFWCDGSSIALDENDIDEWHGWESERFADLEAVVPRGWPLMFPIAVHPDFVAWFQGRYDTAVAGLSETARAYQAESPGRRWRLLFAESADTPRPSPTDPEETPDE